MADAKLWETWPHAKIAIWVKFIWGCNSKTHLDLNTQLDKFKIDLNSPQLAIFNTLGEEALMLSIHELFLGYPKLTIECPQFLLISY